MRLMFDLDGTLTDPGRGIIRCIQHALAGLGRPVPSSIELAWCVGPPLRESFGVLLRSQDAALMERAVVLYRERFVSVEAEAFRNDRSPQREHRRAVDENCRGGRFRHGRG